ncbi:hypothetical protein EVAR_42404_1 [Eumeta japonica]|uniref:Uncharacterized protein n=1 Tax=Eumeta variegata TaxID=151549 RepID=A0A4C1XAX8_EUMVA|nr:hypothetical protein EVAR_42404_1 [Eumeta japonica]
MYAASTTSTTSGSAGCGVRPAGGGERRVRVVRLLRPRRSTPAFGFSMRGGCEHSTGFFISKIEVNSEAYHQGLKLSPCYGEGGKKPVMGCPYPRAQGLKTPGGMIRPYRLLSAGSPGQILERDAGSRWRHAGWLTIEGRNDGRIPTPSL